MDVVVPAAATREETSLGTVSPRKPIPKAVVVDADLVPRGFCMPDERRIRDFVLGIAAAMPWDEAEKVFAERLPGVEVTRVMPVVVNTSRRGKEVDA
jgi:hypothetical protein